MLLTTLLTFLNLTLAASSQTGEILFRQVGLANESLGYSLANMGDWNGDGMGDFLASGASDVVIFSGADHSRLLTIPDDGYLPEHVLCPGDLDLDGIDDIAVARWNDNHPSLRRPGSIAAYSGATGALIYKTHGQYDDMGFGFTFVDIEDTNGDGIRDFAVGAWGYNPLAAPVLVSGADGQILGPLSTIFGSQTYVANAGDINQDGVEDLLRSDDFTGTVYVQSGADFSLLLTIQDIPNQIGAWPKSVGDTNLDGIPDIVVMGTNRITMQDFLGLYSGANGQLLLSWESWDTSGFNRTCVAPGDFNGDGRADIVVASSSASSSGAISVFSGADGTTLFRSFDGHSPYASLGLGMTGVGDWNQDGYDDILVSAPFAREYGSGMGRQGFFTLYAGGPSAPKPSLSLQGTCPGPWTVSVIGAAPGARLGLLVGPLGSTNARNGPCHSLRIGIDQPQILGIERANPQGERTLILPAGSAGLCGQGLLLVDLDACVPSNVVVIP